MDELDDNIHLEVITLCETGDELARRGNYEGALEKYWKAFELLPEPKTDWQAGTRILVAIGDTNYLHGDFKAGSDALDTVMHFPEAIGNPFIHLRLGQCHFEMGNLDKAADELTRAYAVDGEGLFDDEDVKYFEFLKTRIQPSSAKKKWWLWK